MRIVGWFLSVTGFVLVMGAHDTVEAAPAENLNAILDHVDDLYRGSSSHGNMTMHVVTSSATRDLKIEQWSKGQDKFLMRIQGPEKEKGISTLMSGSNVWNYFPKVNQVTKLSPSMMGASWMGSHLTNNEIVKRSRMAKDYNATKTFDGQRDGVDVKELTLMPKPDAAVVWGKIVVTTRKGDDMPVKILYFDEGKKLAQTVTFLNEKPLGGRTLPTTLKFVPADKANEYTEVRWQTLEFNVNVDDNLFSHRNLQK